MNWTAAITVDICRECRNDILPGDKILRGKERIVCFLFPATYKKVIFCEDCGILYLESQDLGNDRD